LPNHFQRHYWFLTRFFGALVGFWLAMCPVILRSNEWFGAAFFQKNTIAGIISFIICLPFVNIKLILR